MGNKFSYRGAQIVLPDTVPVNARYAIWRGRYEVDEADMIERHLSLGDDVIELGGSLGVISALIRRKIGAGAKHVVVEANPNLTPVLRRNAGGGEGTIVVNAAVTAAGAEPTTKFVTSDDTLASSLFRNGGGENANSVPTTTLRQLADEHSISEFVLVCDIEGGEAEIFLGDELQASNCRMVIVEMHPAILRDRGLRISDLLSAAAANGLTKLDQAGNVYVMARSDSGDGEPPR